MQNTTLSASSFHGGIPTINNSAAVIGGAAYIANSYNFTPAVNHGVPQHQGHVFVEHNNGMFVPLNVHNQIENKKIQDQQTSGIGSFGGGGATWNFHEDAKDYRERLESVMRFLARLRDMVNGLASGFAFFKIMELYTNADARADNSIFLASYETGVDIVPKCFLFLCILLLVLSLLPMGFDFAMESLAAITFGTQFSANAQRSTLHQQQQHRSLGGMNDISVAVSGVSSAGGAHSGAAPPPAGVSGSGGQFGRFTSALAANTYQRLFRFLGWSNPTDSPFRHLLQVRFLAFLSALAMTILEIAVVDQRSLPLVDSLSSSSVSTLHAAIIARAAVLLVSWLFSLKDF
ncbi:transmembrane protein, putative [Bodo saltans]|uniref:Transmembrane protein, putative n=1 Tax=Bodo saltans TaxID=75058 RepID=A0A0S4J0F2_BODSA|nr:transmembrane protein, putative [Bodo saltans]|eukprot:CUG35224.1 transmembrane protein, putative [Bodo saltans]